MSPNSPAVAGQPLLLLRLEGAALVAAALFGYWMTAASWWLFLVLFLVPDVSFAAYLLGSRIGATVYNAVHSTIGPILLGLYGFWFGPVIIISIALIWAAHCGFDRLLGYGLKYPTGFRDTHLGRIGRPGAGTKSPDRH